MDAEDIVVDLIALNGGELVGRTRLQKGAYLLHRCGADFGLPFIYHHYGPYSSDLASGCLDALAEGWIEIEERPGRHGVRYAIFRLREDACPSDNLGALSADEARPLLRKIGKVSDTVLELAATIVYFVENGSSAKAAVEETKARKSIKASPERLREAFSLIRDLGLDPKSELKNEFAPAG